MKSKKTKRTKAIQGFFTGVPNIILRNPDLSVGEKVIFSVILSLPEFGDTFKRYISNKDLAFLAGLSEKTACKYASQLVRRGILAKKSGNGIKRQASVYTIFTPANWKIKPIDGFSSMAKATYHKRLKNISSGVSSSETAVEPVDQSQVH